MGEGVKNTVTTFKWTLELNNVTTGERVKNYAKPRDVVYEKTPIQNKFGLNINQSQSWEYP